MSIQSVPSSPDPLAPSPVSSPTRFRPLTSRPSNIISSPSKSMVFQTGNGDGKSPMRIRVTVQEEPEIDRSPIRPRTRTTKVPLKASTSSSPVKRSARKSSKPATPGSEEGSFRNPTLPRRRGTLANAQELPRDEDHFELDNSYYLSSATRSGDELRTLSKNVPTGRKATESASSPLLPLSSETPRAVSGRDLHQNSVQRLQDEDMWRAMINKSAEGADLLSFVEQDDAEYSLSEEDSEEEDAVLGAAAPGDDTVMESEGFSMISVNSLPSSRHSAASSPVPLSQQPQYDGTEAGDRSYADTGVSFMPSSPPVLFPRLVTPLTFDQSLILPGAPEPASVLPDKVLSPRRQSVVMSSSALQDALRSPERLVPPPRHTPVQNSIFGGFGSGTRRKLQASLQIGEHLATPPPEATQTRVEHTEASGNDLQQSADVSQHDNLSLTIHYRSQSVTLEFPADATITHLSSTIAANLSVPPENQKFLISSLTGLQRPPFTDPSLALSSLTSKKITLMGSANRTQSTEHRLPTPDEREHSESQSSSVDPTQEVQYPSLTKKLEEMNLPTSNVNYDAMSWVPTGPPKAVSQSQKADGENAAETTSTNKVGPDNRGEAQMAAANDVGDIWQEEASRSIEMEHPAEESLHPGDLFLDDLPVKPRRSKLPRTWRRTSGHNFHYSDSPEPEALEVRRVSDSTTAPSRSGDEVTTPPATEDETGAVEEEQMSDYSDESEDSEEDSEEQPSQVSNQRGLSPMSDSDASATDGDDTGCFWQSNMPSVFGRREQSELRNKNLVLEVPSGLKDKGLTISPLKGGLNSSPLRDTVFDSSPVKLNQANRSSLRMKTMEGNAKRSPKMSSAISTPLRESLLRTSKVRTSPLARSIMKRMEKQSLSEGGDSSVASDARQLLDEMAAQQTATRVIKRTNERSLSGVDVSHESSVASDARQLLNEMAEQQRRTVFQTPVSEEDSSSAMTPAEESSGEETSRSYEENLNRNSPVRVAVKFNDSGLNSSLLASKKTYPPLFDDVPNLQQQKPAPGPSTVPTSAAAEPEQSSGIFSRFTSFWSAAAKPANKSTVLLDNTSSAPPKLAPLVYSIPDTTLRLRRRYGLLPDVFPFTYRHVRTLHRMMNSSRYHASTCIIPRHGPLPRALATLPGAKKTNFMGQEYVWDEAGLQVVAGFMSLLLPAGERARLEELEDWGDDQAAGFRGYDRRGRHGDDIVYPDRKEWATGRIEVLWIASLVIDIVWREERAVPGW